MKSDRVKRGQASATILLAEDNEDTVITISEYLTINGYHVIVAPNGKEAIEMAQKEQPDLILMDIQMPVMDGLEAIHRIRAIPDIQHIPIIALTAMAMPGDEERCLEAGADTYISKPVGIHTLLTAVEKQLQ